MMRRLWPDRNPLRRAADRAEAAVMAGLLAMFMAGVPLAAVADSAGKLEGTPVRRADVTIWEAFGALAAAVLAVAAVAITGLFARRALDRRRLAAWDAEWSRTGPQWTGRL